MTASTYRTDFSHQCRTHDLDGMVLAFHRPSGTTHLLASPMPEILELLAERPMTAEALCQALCDRLGLPPDDEALVVVEARLGELIASGLVQAS